MSNFKISEKKVTQIEVSRLGEWNHLLVTLYIFQGAMGAKPPGKKKM